MTGSLVKNLKINLKKDDTRINESMTFQLEPQLALSVLNSLPFLIDYPYGCVEQTLNKFTPLAITNEIYKKFPSLKEAVAKLPKRDTLTPEWEKDDPRRLQSLMETPWVWQSEGLPVDCSVIDLLNPKIVETKKQSAFERLKNAQLSNGGFPWWPGGGDADPYITLYVLSGFAEARKYGVEIDNNIINNVLRYVNNKIPLLLKAEERDLATVCYAAYVITSFSKNDYSQAAKGFNAAKNWVIFLEKNIHLLTPLGKAYLAFSFHRLGDTKKAMDILEMALDGGREDEIAGFYWTPEKYSWVWYSDSLEKHSFFLKALMELKPSDKRIPGMVQWILFNRKGTVWKSTKASASAIYALLDFMQKSGALTSDDNFKVLWSGTTTTFSVKPDDFLEKPIKIHKTGGDAVEFEPDITIEKSGKGIAFASLTMIYSTDEIPEESAQGLLNVERKYFLREKQDDGKYHLKELKTNSEIKVGDQLEVQLKINTRSQFEYMHLLDPKPAGFEAETLLSGWKWSPLPYYEEPRDSLTNMFISWLPHGEFIVKYRLKPTKAGVYRAGAAILQSMYAPEMTAHSAGFVIRVKP